jgi:hypothetical protein
MEDKILAEESKLDGVAASDERSSAETEKLRNALAEAQAQIESQALKYQVSHGVRRSRATARRPPADNLRSAVRLRPPAEEGRRH